MMADDAARVAPIDVYDPERLRIFRETLEANPAEVGAFVTTEQGWFCGLLDRAARCVAAEQRAARRVALEQAARALRADIVRSSDPMAIHAWVSCTALSVALDRIDLPEGDALATSPGGIQGVTMPPFEFVGRVYLRPLGRGICLGDDLALDLADALTAWLRAVGQPVSPSAGADVRLRLRAELVDGAPGEGATDG